MNNSIKTKEIKKLLISHSSFSIARYMFNVFMNLYIWKLTSDISLIGLYNVTFFIFHIASFTYFAKYVKNNRTNQTKSIGIIGLLLFYLLVFYLNDKSVNHLVPLAITSSIFNAMYWVSYHTQNFDATHTKNRGHYAGAEKVVKNSAALITPILGGALISINIWGLGYGSVFLVAAFMQIISLATGQIDLPHVNSIRSYHPFKTFKKIWSQNEQKKVLLAGSFSNIGYARSTEKILTIFLFIILGTELHVGGILTFFACFSVISTYLVGRYIDYNKLKNIALYWGIILSTSFAGLITLPGLITYIIFGSIKQIAGPLIGLGRRVYGLNLLHIDNETEKHRVEFIVIREWFSVGIGATISYLPLLFIKEFTIANLTPILLFMSFATFLEGIVIYSIKTDITKL